MVFCVVTVLYMCLKHFVDFSLLFKRYIQQERLYPMKIQGCLLYMRISDIQPTISLWEGQNIPFDARKIFWLKNFDIRPLILLMSVWVTGVIHNKYEHLEISRVLAMVIHPRIDGERVECSIICWRILFINCDMKASLYIRD